MFLQSKADDLKPLGDCIEMLDNIHAEPVQTNHWIDSEDVSNMFSSIKVHKSHCSDGLPHWLLSDFESVQTNLCTLEHIDAGGISPDTMEDAYVTVVPKVNPPKSKSCGSSWFF